MSNQTYPMIKDILLLIIMPLNHTSLLNFTEINQFQFKSIKWNKNRCEVWPHHPNCKVPPLAPDPIEVPPTHTPVHLWRCTPLPEKTSQSLCSSGTCLLKPQRTKLCTMGNLAFCSAAPSLWNTLWDLETYLYQKALHDFLPVLLFM